MYTRAQNMLYTVSKQLMNRSSNPIIKNPVMKLPIFIDYIKPDLIKRDNIKLAIILTITIPIGPNGLEIR